MQTAVISYRVADFLKQHPPFQAMEEADLLGLAAHGRVRFHEADEYLCSQGAPPDSRIFVIQHGTVAIWEETAGTEHLRDIRGAGDMVGIERFAGADTYLYSAKSTSDVVVYAFPAADFAVLVERYPEAARYLAAHASVSAQYEAPEEHPDAGRTFVYDLARAKPFATCGSAASVRDVVRLMRNSGARAIALRGAQQEVVRVITSEDLIRWIAEGSGDADAPVSEVLTSGSAVSVISPEIPVSDCVLELGSRGATAAAITTDGSPTGAVLGVITGADLSPSFGEQPLTLLDDIRGAERLGNLRRLNRRVRGFILDNLFTPASVEWLARFASIADAAIFERILRITEASAAGCWCFCGDAGREELLTQRAPQPVLISSEGARAAAAYDRVHQALIECDYLPSAAPFEPAFWCADAAEWARRFEGWVRDPVESGIYAARPLFDLRPVAEDAAFRELSRHVARSVTWQFLFLLANDCLDNLPPLTFFRDAVVHESGEQRSVFELERTALQPLVDVARVFGIAAASKGVQGSGRGVLGGSTLARFAMAKSMVPEQEAIFREASDTMRMGLYQQARIGIRRRGDGAELPPNLLSRHDRQILKTGFRSILRLLEYTAECKWLPRT